VRASYLEIYNETLNDLLNPSSTGLQLRYEAKRGAFVQNLLQVDCESLEDAMLVLAEGMRNRKVTQDATEEGRIGATERCKECVGGAFVRN
jgi:hypothetical protein